MTLAGNTVPVEPRVLELLLHLIEDPDRMVGKGELLQRHWPGNRTSIALTAARSISAFCEEI